MPIIQDFKKPDGSWALGTTTGRGTPNGRRSHFTLSGQKWYAMNDRCNPGGSVQKFDPSYAGCSNEFTDFQEFVEWHRSKVGYGQGFEVDKDLRVRGNKVYSPTTCSLLPGRINRFITRSTRSSKGLPLGVFFREERNRYVADCRDAQGVKRRLGHFMTAEDAFTAYKIFKETELRCLADEWKDRIEPQYYEALINFEITPH